jgi:hypothetical protein
MPSLTLGGSAALIPLSFVLVVAATHLGVQFGEMALVPVAILGIVAAYLPYVGALLFVLLAIFWIRVFYLERSRRVDQG